eukprot:3835689-Pyramimonas_sp.AAC.1
MLLSKYPRYEGAARCRARFASSKNPSRRPGVCSAVSMASKFQEAKICEDRRLGTPRSASRSTGE